MDNVLGTTGDDTPLYWEGLGDHHLLTEGFFDLSENMTALSPLQSQSITFFVFAIFT